MARLLSNRIQAIEYIHADDGEAYRHDFKRGGKIELEKNGSIKIKNPGRPLWDMYTVSGRHQPFLENPPMAKRAKKRVKSRVGKKRRSAAQRRATRALVALHKGGTVAKRRKGSKKRNAPRRAVARVKRRRGRKSRNPKLSLKSVGRTLMDGVAGGAAMTAGLVGVRLVSSQFAFADGSVIQGLIEGASAVGLGLILPGLIGEEYAADVMKGGISSPMINFIFSLNIPHVSNLLSGAPSGTDVRYLPADAPNVVASLGRPRTMGIPALGLWSNANNGGGATTMNTARRVVG